MAPWLALTSFAAYEISALEEGGPQKEIRDTDGEKGTNTSKYHRRGRECLQKNVKKLHFKWS